MSALARRGVARASRLLLVGAALAACGSSDTGASGAGGATAGTGGAPPSAGAGGTAFTPAPSPSFAGELAAEVSGDDGFDWAGYSLQMAGDVNGDGRPDALVTSLSATPGGHVAVLLGPLRGNRTMRQADALLTGEFTFHNAGQSLIEAGRCDLDGDGVADLLVGSPFADRTDIAVQAMISGDNNGRAYIVFGSPSLADTWAPGKQTRLSQASVTFVGEQRYDAAGTMVACAGDLDGDGKDEMLIGAPRVSREGRPRAGATYLIYGRERAAFDTVINLEKADAVFLGESGFDASGTLAARVGDLTGDGRPDLAIGAPGRDEGATDAGAVYIVAGGPQRFAGPVDLSTATAVLLGHAAGQRVGLSFTSAGDATGDSLPDLLLGTSSVSAALKLPGEAFLVPGGALAGRASAASLGLTLVGESNGDNAGLGVASLGDLDLDGKNDVAIGAPAGDGLASGAGRVYAVRGRALTPGTTSPLAAEKVIARGGDVEDHLGEVLQGGQDLDGDGLPDLLISARGRASTRQASGSVFLLSGKGLLP